MTITLPAFTPMEESLFLTLCARALDNRRRSPSSPTPWPTRSSASSATTASSSHIEYEPHPQHHTPGQEAGRGGSRFLARHPNAVGLDLGAGLDTRVVRLDPPSTVDWYDVDFPAVAAARNA